MPAIAHTVAVVGALRAGPDRPQLVLTERLRGYDTFLTGVLEYGRRHVPVRIITLDDVTVLRPVDADGLDSATATCTGVLHLAHGARRREIPDDLAAEAERHHRSLMTFDDAELRYALTFLEEATTPAIRQARIAAIVAALPAPSPSHPTGSVVAALAERT